jgi:hypothetical protein
MQFLPGNPTPVETFRTSIAVSAETIDRACSLLDQLECSSYGKVLELVVLLNASIVSYEAYDFSSALIGAWTVCEVLITACWQDYLEKQSSARGGISASRRNKLAGRDFTASVMSEILELAHELPREVLSKLDRARKQRNDWIHGMKPPRHREVKDCIELACELLQEKAGFDFKLELSIRASRL